MAVTNFTNPICSWAPSRESASALPSDSAGLAYRQALESLLERQAALAGERVPPPQLSLVAQFLEFLREVVAAALGVVQRSCHVADVCVYRLARLFAVFLVIVSMVCLGLCVGVAASSPAGYGDLIAWLFG
jgi:hypothetical protein